jgi:hypothetical protein
LPEAVAAVRAALDSLLAMVDTARTTHDQLSATAWSLRQRAEALGCDVDLIDPQPWTGTLEQACPKDTASRNLMLSLIQRRGAHAALAEIERLIQMRMDAQRRSLR